MPLSNSSGRNARVINDFILPSQAWVKAMELQSYVYLGMLDYRDCGIRSINADYFMRMMDNIGTLAGASVGTPFLYLSGNAFDSATANMVPDMVLNQIINYKGYTGTGHLDISGPAMAYPGLLYANHIVDFTVPTTFLDGDQISVRSSEGGNIVWRAVTDASLPFSSSSADYSGRTITIGIHPSDLPTPQQAASTIVGLTWGAGFQSGYGVTTSSIGNVIRVDYDVESHPEIIAPDDYSFISTATGSFVYNNIQTGQKQRLNASLEALIASGMWNGAYAEPQGGTTYF